MITKEQYMQELLDKYDPDVLVDVLGISSEELLERFDDKVEEKLDSIEEDDDDDVESE